MAPLKRKSNAASDKYGSSEKRDFHVYDKVFARLRGYPPWPAKITNIKVDAKSKSLKSKCEVYFYGSNQIGQCAFTDIHDYEANKERFKDICQSSKNLKNTFQLALEEIENDNGPLLDEMEDGSVQKISFDDSVEESTPQTKKQKRNESVEENDNGPLLDEMEDGSVQKISFDDSVEESTLQTKKQKMNESVEESTPKSKKKRSVGSRKEETVTNVEPYEEDVVNERAEDSERQDVSSDKTQPNLDDEDSPANNDTPKPSSSKTRPRRKTASTTPQHTSTARPASPPVQIEKAPAPTIPMSKYDDLRTECSLLALENSIKESLTLNRVDFAQALSALNSIVGLKVTRLMLKKNPEVMDTIRKCQR
ncbi:hepatoma-derived growth factor-like [Diaphorina citri]|uniref:Hepatoma-derived growth factor-like n=1 Tax=Diaphorina citri TaxID=121845 RepID=A0A3Q0ITF2_DIACI|nr:hepatoma-derived growth factor-like [Diaphorina citri]